MADYKLIDIKGLKFKKLSKKAKLLIRVHKGHADSMCDIVTPSVLVALSSIYPDRPIKYIYRIYKYINCAPSEEYGFSMGGETSHSIKRGSLEDIEEEVNKVMLPLYFFSIGGFSWELIKNTDEEEN